MSTKQTASDVPNSRARIMTAILFTLLAVMIVVDIFARWRGASTPSQPGVTQRYR